MIGQLPQNFYFFLLYFPEARQSKQHFVYVIFSIERIRVLWVIWKYFAWILIRNKKFNCNGPWAFKSQRVGYQSNQNIVSLSAFKKSTWFINSFLKYSRFYELKGSYELKGFDLAHPKITELTFSFPEFVPVYMQKLTLFYLFIFEIQLILEPCDQTGHTHFWPCPFKKNLSAFDFWESVSTCTKSIYPICSFSRYKTGHTHFWPCPPQSFPITF